jgi:hypothetical protein
MPSGKGREATVEEDDGMKQVVGPVISAIVGLVITIASGMALVPRVRSVEVLTVIAGAIGSGAALAVVVVQIRQARATEQDKARGRARRV